MMRVMGVVNVTPDSFVGAVRTPTVEAAVARCHQLVADGAAIIDIGGESTRPGSTSIPLEEELDRVMPVLERFAREAPRHIEISIDTQKESVARAAVGAGAHIINDMGASLGKVAGELGVGYVAAHMLETPETMQNDPTYDDVVAEVVTEVVATATQAAAAGATEVWIDPGIGFGKTIEHNLALVAHLDTLVETSWPVLVGVSRKGFLGRLHTAADQGVPLAAAKPTPTDDRLEASIALAAWSVALGANVVRVHDVVATVQALKVVAARPTA